MAQECTLIFETEPPIPFTCADGTGIEKAGLQGTYPDAYQPRQGHRYGIRQR